MDIKYGLCSYKLVGTIYGVDAEELYFEISAQDRDLCLPAPWRVQTELWVQTFNKLLRGDVDLLGAYSVLQENYICNLRNCI